MKQLLSFSLFCSAMAVAPLAYSSTIVVPSGSTFDSMTFDAATDEGNSNESTSLGGTPNTVQVVFNASVLQAGGLQVGDVLNGLAFRIGGGPSTRRPAPNFTVNNYVIRLSTSLNSAGNLNDTFALNRGTDFTEVRSGALTFNAADYDDSNNGVGEGPNDFGPAITFNNTFTYQGGDLLLEYTHNLNTEVDTTAMTSEADALNNLNGVQTLFGEGFDATERGFGDNGSDVGFAPVVQFSVIPEPSTGILSGMGLLGLLLRRRR